MSDQLREYAKKHTILDVRTGSHLYGTSTPESDEDFAGIFLPPEEYILGLKTVAEVDIGIEDRAENGKNTKKAVDYKLYSFQKFVSLALANNPNIIELLFINDDNILSLDETGEELLSLAPSFLCKTEIENRFLAYAKAQKHKMIVKKENLDDLYNAVGYLSLFDDKVTMGQAYDYQNQIGSNNPLIKKPTGPHIHIGDICFEPAVYVKKARVQIQERIDKASYRSEMILKYGYDLKFSSHLIRLIYEGIELLQTGKIIFPLQQVEVLKEIRAGKYTCEQVIEMSEKLEKTYKEVASKSTVPLKADYNKIEKFVVRSMMKYLFKIWNSSLNMKANRCLPI